MLLHCYPFVREAGWLAHVYANVWFDLSLHPSHTSRARRRRRYEEALELAPLSKLLYASDAARTPELYLPRGHLVARPSTPAAVLNRTKADARLVLRENALTLYRL